MTRLSRLLILFLLLSPTALMAEVLTENTVWQGEVELKEDLLIPSGVTLTVKAGTKVTVWPAENTKIDPEYLSHQTEILVRGELNIQGTKQERVVMDLAPDQEEDARWTGILVDGGRLQASHLTISGAEAAVHGVGKSAISLDDPELTVNRYGLIAQGAGSKAVVTGGSIRANDYGILGLSGGVIHEQGVVIANNDNNDRFFAKVPHMRVTPKVYESTATTVSRIYGNETLQGNTTWSGRIRIEGQVRVSPEARLLIMPGTLVEFSKRDTNSDGIGENGILVQGAFIAKGTAEQPILFRSAEKERAMGDWDSINILGSDLTRNLIEFCQIEDAYRGMHFHFANVAVTNSVLRNNYRGIQFQESLVEIRQSQFYWNKSAIQARDSEVNFFGNHLFNNLNGANLFRLSLRASKNVFANNSWDGLRIREGATFVEHNTMVANRFGLLVADTVFGKFSANLLAANLEAGLALKNTDNIETAANAILANRLNGIIVRDSRGVINGNLIADNGERGIGILSFVGRVSGNTIAKNGLYAIGLEGSNDLDARGNWWGTSDLAKEIFDSHDEPGLGTVDFSTPLPEPQLFIWPLESVPVELTWHGRIGVERTVTVPANGALTVAPATEVRFADEQGMLVYGKILALGTETQPITFTSLAGKGPEDWGEIYIERAMGSAFAHSRFHYATWGIHSHYVDLKVSECLFEYNDGGLRFNSGPLAVSGSTFRNNRIGTRSFRGIGEFRNNHYTANEIGIYIRENGSAVKVNYNNIHDNTRYNMRLGDFNDEDVDARYNWWGGVDVTETVFDGNRESYIGMVIHDPVLEQPASLSQEAAP